MKRSPTFATALSTMALALAVLPGSAAASTNPSNVALTLRQSTRTVTFPQNRDRANLALTAEPAAQSANLRLAGSTPPPSLPASSMMRKRGGQPSQVHGDYDPTSWRLAGVALAGVGRRRSKPVCEDRIALPSDEDPRRLGAHVVDISSGQGGLFGSGKSERLAVGGVWSEPVSGRIPC